MTNPTHPASGEAVSCFHEAYQGFCAHCGVKIVNGLAQVRGATPSPDKLKIAIEGLERARSITKDRSRDDWSVIVETGKSIDAALSALKGEE